MTIKQSTKYLLVYVLMLIILSAIVLYGVVLPTLVSAPNTLSVAAGIIIGVGATPVYFYLMYQTLSALKKKENEDEKGNDVRPAESDRSDDRMQ